MIMHFLNTVYFLCKIKRTNKILNIINTIVSVFNVYLNRLCIDFEFNSFLGKGSFGKDSV